MKASKETIAFIIATGFSCLPFLSQTAHAETAKNDYGQIVLKEYRGSRTCSFPLNEKGYVTVKIRQSDNIPGCNFQFFEKIQLTNTKSAITLYFDSFAKLYQDLWVGTCGAGGESYKYRIELKTGPGMPMTGEFNLDEALRKNPQNVVVPGVRLISKMEKNSSDRTDLNEAFACLHVSPSD